MASPALGRSGLGVGKAHPEIAMGSGIDRALAPVARADRRRQSFGGLEIDDQAMGREPPIDEADYRNGDIVQADFNLALIAIGIGQPILPKFGQRAADIARQFLALLIAARIGIERGFAIEGAFRFCDAGLNGKRRIVQADIDARLDRLAARGGNAGGRSPPEQAFHDPKSGFGGWSCCQMMRGQEAANRTAINCEAQLRSAAELRGELPELVDGADVSVAVARPLPRFLVRRRLQARHIVPAAIDPKQFHRAFNLAPRPFDQPDVCWVLGVAFAFRQRVASLPRTSMDIAPELHRLRC